MPEVPRLEWSNEARRAADEVMLHVHAVGADAVGKWVAIRLSDGGSDGVLYPTKLDAVRHQLHETLCCYVRIPPNQTVTARQMEAFLKLNRGLYANGARLADPDHPHGGPDPIVPIDYTVKPGRLVVPRQRRRF